MTKQTTEVKPAEMRTDHREQRGKDVFVVPLSRITVQEDFNKRADDNYGDIDELSESIKANGQIQHGFGYRNADGTWVLTAGHRRFAALHRIAEATGKEQTMLLMKAPKDNVSRLVIQYVENVKHPNTEWDRAMIIKGLLAEGLKPKEVIAKLGIPQPTFYALKNLLDTAPEVQQALKNGEVSGTTVNKMVASLKDKGEKLAAAVKEATAKAKAEQEEAERQRIAQEREANAKAREEAMPKVTETIDHGDGIKTIVVQGTEPAAQPAPAASSPRLDETPKAAAHTGITGSARLLDRLDDLARQMTERELSELCIHAAHMLENRKQAA